MEGGGVRSETKSRRVIKTPSWIPGFRPSSHQAAVTPACACLHVGYVSVSHMDACLHNAHIYWFLTQTAFVIQERLYVPPTLLFFFFFLSALQMSPT